MAQKSRKKRKRGSRPTASRGLGGARKRELTPEERLPETFRVMYEVASEADTLGNSGGAPETPRARFEFVLFVRGVNAVKASRLLLTESHWEIAASAARQLFELVVNVEHLRAQDDQDAALLRYGKFALLQTALDTQRSMLYDQAKRRSIDEERLALIEEMLANGFPEFRRVAKNGRVTWAPSWSGLSTLELAKNSPQRMRLSQYEQLFRTWSEQVHAAPGALAPILFGDTANRTVDDMLREDEGHVAQVGAMVVILFVDLWRLLDAVPQVDPTRIVTWTRDLAKEGARYAPLDRLNPDDPFFRLLEQ